MKLLKNAISLLVALLLLVQVAEADTRKQKNTATYYRFEIRNSSDGSLITGATGLDCERAGFSDGSAPSSYTDVSGTETEIGSTGTYYVAMNTTDTNFDYIAIQCKSSSTNAMTWTDLIDTKHGTLLTDANGAADSDTIPGNAFKADGTLQSATGTTAVLAAAETYANSELVGREICTVAGTGKGQCREITANVGSTDTVTVPTWTTAPDNTTKYILGGYVTATLSGSVTCGSLGSTAKSDVNAEVVDALNVDTYAELSSCPGAPTTLTTMVRFLYEYFRHKMLSTSSVMTLKKDDGSTSLCTNAISDDGTTFSRGEMN